ncbi:hypothetical protein F4555_001253 [Mobiluncus mulieris]|uniref:hypothetical protein n=1 Tax=Mobiluncus mulieris TaxID=2052 RepID=UPI00135C1681|nr:hypothetical protein [Mobiluncus mulieris]MBB5846457.1 hypothetical protein [Mobiluncus mulieris]
MSAEGVSARAVAVGAGIYFIPGMGQVTITVTRVYAPSTRVHPKGEASNPAG